MRDPRQTYSRQILGLQSTLEPKGGFIITAMHCTIPFLSHQYKMTVFREGSTVLTSYGSASARLTDADQLSRMCHRR